MDKYFKSKKRICCKDTGEIYFGYANYLKSQHWALTRSRIIQNHPYCEMCKSADKPLQVHHLSYKRLGKEKDSDLTPLCDECHVAVHQMEKIDAVKLLRSKSKTQSDKLKPKRKTCKGCIFYKRNEKTKHFYCKIKHLRTTGNTNACSSFKTNSNSNLQNQTT